MGARVLAVLLVFSAPAAALETASFLTIGPGARGMAMGSAYAALSGGADSLYWNPAGLARMKTSEVMADDAELPQSTRLNDAFVAAPTAFGAVGLGGTYLSQSVPDGRNALGQPTGAYGASDGDASVGAALKNDYVDMGGAVKYIRSHIAASEAQTVAVDLGLKRALGPVDLAATVRNLGPGMKFAAETDDLPLRLDAAAAYRFTGGHALTAQVTNAPRAGGTTAGVGGEFQPLKGIFLRAGYSSQPQVAAGAGLDAVNGVTFGFGLKQARWSLDYAAAPMGELGTTQRFSAAYRW